MPQYETPKRYTTAGTDCPICLDENRQLESMHPLGWFWMPIRLLVNDHLDFYHIEVFAAISMLPVEDDGWRLWDPDRIIEATDGLDPTIITESLHDLAREAIVIVRPSTPLGIWIGGPPCEHMNRRPYG